MRTIVIGDIHGCLTALRTLAKFVGLGEGDRLITLGDYVDRGPDSAGVIDWLIEWRQQRELIALRGNHEVMMIHARVNGAVVPEWLGFGGEATMVSYHAFTMSGIPPEHWEFIEQVARPWAELENDFFVHATVKPDLPLADQDDVSIYWDAFGTDLGPHCSGKRMVCGHTAQKSGLPLDIGHALCIDTKVYSPTGWLTALDLETGEYWQANQAGRTRRSSLAELAEARSG